MKNIIIRIITCLLIIVGALGLGKFLITRKPDLKSQQPDAVIPRVDFTSVEQASYSPEMISYGTVQSYFETKLTPEVKGKITYVSPKFRVGEMIPKGEVLATIDDSDYQSALATQKANLTLRKAALAEEQIRAKQAIGDWKAFGKKLSSASDFVLRKPQLAAAKANVEAAQIAIEKALVDLTRTKITAPYDAVVTVRTASLGNYATGQDSLGTLVATDKAEIRIPLTAEQMKRIKISADEKLKLKLTNPSNPDAVWSAELTRMDPTIDPQNQVSYAIATIEKPYSAKAGALPVGSFVNVNFPSLEIKHCYKVPASALVRDQYVWLVDAQNKLVRADAERIHSDALFTYIRVRSEELNSPLNIVSRPLSNFRIGAEVQSNEPIKK